MDRHWLLTWTTYGSWLPGDRRGFVSSLRDAARQPVIHNQPQTPYDTDLPRLEVAMRSRMKGQPVRLLPAQADAIEQQFQETAAFRGWRLAAGAVMANHVHLVVGVPGDPEPETLLHAFKSYGSRVLNRRWSKPPNGTWWTESGSRRKLPDAAAIHSAVRYVRDQQHALRIWIDETALYNE